MIIIIMNCFLLSFFHCLVWIVIFSLYVPAIKAGLKFDQNYTYEWKFRNDIIWVSVAKYSLQFHHCHHLFADIIINAKLTLSAEAILHALIIIRSSMRLSFTSPLPVWDCNVDQCWCISKGRLACCKEWRENTSIDKIILTIATATIPQKQRVCCWDQC